MKIKQCILTVLVLISMSVSGCTSKGVVNENKNDLIYQESISPNEQYVDNEQT